MSLSTYQPKMAAVMTAQPHLKTALSMLEKEGFAAHLVGGYVRDTLMGRPSADMDISTSARPDDVARIFESAGCAVHPTGIAHGTLTVVVGGEPFEITTWRNDVTTDGRRATIAFADTMHEDAMRRDFTINALYAAQDGTVFDPTGCGLSDIAAQKITFIGSAHDRIWEDHLRILRYYRFAASHGSGPADGDDLEACLQLGFLVSSLPRERIGAEMIKLFKAYHAIRCLHTMKKSHLLAAIMPKLSIAHEVMEARFASVVLQENLLGLTACPYRRIAALVDEAPKDELKLSNLHADRIGKIISAANSPMAPSVLGYRFGYDIAEEALIHREATGNPGSVSAQSIDRARYGSQQVFPLKAKDIPDTFKGRALGSELKRLEALWISQGFSLL